jgi:hypothetical protein
MNELIEFIREFDLHNLVGIGIVFCVITRVWKNEVRLIKEETKSIRDEIAQQAARTDKLYEMFVELLKGKS